MRGLVLTVSGLALVVATAGLAPGASADEVPPAPAVVTTRDAAGDATGGTGRARRAADVRSVRYQAPGEPSGTLRLTTVFDELYVYQGARRVKQQARHVLTSPNGKRRWAITVSNLGAQIRVVRLHGDSPARVQPRFVGRIVGAGGRPSLAAEVSIEWLPVDRVRVTTTARSGKATDATRSLRVQLR